MVRHQGESTESALNVSDPSELAFAAFYADCEHETKPIDKGHRVALVFNLVAAGQPSEGDSSPPDSADHLERAALPLRDCADKRNAGRRVV